MTTKFSGQDSDTGRPADIAAVGAPGERAGDEPRQQTVVDLLLVVVRWRKAALAVAGATLAVGVLVTITLPEKYEYSTTIEIGRVEVTGLLGGRWELLESIQTVQAKLENSYVPLVLTRYRERRPSDDSDYKIAVSSPRGSSVVILRSRAQALRSETYLALHQEVVDELVADHSRLVSLLRSEIEAELGRAEVALGYEEDPSTLKTQESELESRLLDSEIKLQDLRHSEILETRPVIPPIQSLRPVEGSRFQVLSIALVLSVVFAILSAFVADLATRLRRRMAIR